MYVNIYMYELNKLPGDINWSFAPTFSQNHSWYTDTVSAFDNGYYSGNSFQKYCLFDNFLCLKVRHGVYIRIFIVIKL